MFLFRKANSDPLVLSWDTCDDLLSDDDKQFLRNKPDYNAHISKLQLLKENDAIYKAIKQKTAHIKNSTIKTVEEKLEVEKKKVFQYLESQCIL